MKEEITITNANGTVEHLYQWNDCQDENCNVGKHPFCWRCARCKEIHTSSRQAQICAGKPQEEGCTCDND